MTNWTERAESISQIFSEIYYRCHPSFTISLTHQAVRALQYLGMNSQNTVSDVAQYLNCAHNTASEVLRRLGEKGLILRQRSKVDERIVEVQLTDEGKRVLAEHTGLDIDKLAACMKTMPEQELQIVQQGLNLLLGYMREQHK